LFFKHEKATFRSKIGYVDCIHPDSSESKNARVVRSNDTCFIRAFFIDIYNKPSRLRYDKSQFLQTFVHRIVKILNNQLTVKKMMVGERNLDSAIERYREIILDFVETLLRFFGFDRSVYSNLRRRNSMEIKGMGFGTF
jgi:hypothetical protein